MQSYMLCLLCSFVFVATKAFQQLNVQHNKYLWIPPCSLLMATAEVANIIVIVKDQNYFLILPMATGAVLGCWLSMYLHKWLRG